MCMIPGATCLRCLRNKERTGTVEMKVLIVDSNPNIQYLYKVELEEEGYDVVTASTGREALVKFEYEQPDLVTLEMLLPDINGIALLRLMKEKSPHVPVLMATAYDYHDEFAAFPSDAYLLKSSDLREFKLKIRELVISGHRDPCSVHGLNMHDSLHAH